MTLKKKLDQLRDQWTKFPQKRKIIELQALIIKKCIEHSKEDLQLQKDVVSELLK